jgi:hypothetical protein
MVFREFLIENLLQNLEEFISHNNDKVISKFFNKIIIKIDFMGYKTDLGIIH